MQELFNQMVAGLASQGWKQSIQYDIPTVDQTKVDVCMYRGPDGRKCAIGWLIPDERYKKRMEGKPITSIIYALPDFINITDAMKVTLAELQQLHDNAKSGELKEAFQLYANKNQLTFPESLI